MTVPQAPGSTGSRPSPKSLKASTPSKPLHNIKRELFAQRIAKGVPVKDAYEGAGYGGGQRERWRLRNEPEVKARIDWLLEERVNASTRRRHHREKDIEDIQARLLKRMADIALGDTRDVQQWNRKAIVNSDGDVTGFTDEIDITPSHKLKPEQAALVKGVFRKGDGVRVELVDQLAAMEKLAKMLGMFQDSSPPPVVNNTVNQVNISGDAVEAVRRVAFMLEAANKQAEKSEKAVQPLTIDATPNAAK